MIRIKPGRDVLWAGYILNNEDARTDLIIQIHVLRASVELRANGKIL
jgi:hypothetical protein